MYCYIMVMTFFYSDVYNPEKKSTPFIYRLNYFANVSPKLFIMLQKSYGAIYIYRRLMICLDHSLCEIYTSKYCEVWSSELGLTVFM